MELRAFLCWVVMVSVLFAPRLVSAHDSNVSAIQILKQSDGFLVSIQTHVSKLADAEKISKSKLDKPTAQKLIDKRLTLRFVGASPKLKTTYMIFDEEGDMATLQKSYEGPIPKIEMDSRLYPESKDSATIVSVMEGYKVKLQFALDVDQPSYPSKTQVSIFGQYLKLGISHILGGLDHVAFVVGLLLLGGSLKSIIKVATAFTVAHTITLSLSVCNLASISPGIVEPLIALSVAFVGLEFFYPVAKEKWRPAITFAFGLVHGFGFAGVLHEIGLPDGSIPEALAAFNIGVELGQFAIIIVLVPLLNLATKKFKDQTQIFRQVMSVGITCLGTFWFFERLFSR